MGQDPISSIIQLFAQFYVFIIVLRFLLQMAKADYYNPIAQAVVKIYIITSGASTTGDSTPRQY